MKAEAGQGQGNKPQRRGWWARLFGPKPAENPAALALVDRIRAAARAPAPYQNFAVPDSLDGRFEMIAFYAILTNRRLRRIGPAGVALAEAVFTRLMAEFDAGLRELGLGDLSVGKQVQRMTEAFNGRSVAYGAALDRDAAARQEAIRRNVFGTVANPHADAITALAAHLDRVAQALDRQADDALLAGQIAFPEIAI